MTAKPATDGNSVLSHGTVRRGNVAHSRRAAGARLPVRPAAFVCQEMEGKGGCTKSHVHGRRGVHPSRAALTLILVASLFAT